MKNRVILFGTGKFGHLALQQYGKDEVYCFIDNNHNLWGGNVDGVPVKAVEDGVVESDIYKIIICSKNMDVMEQQLINLGCSNYGFYEGLKGYFPTEELIYNPYADNLGNNTEENWIESNEKKYTFDTINYCTDLIYEKPRLFNHIEIETINRCNGVCDFCPINKNRDSREFHLMSQELFEKIINELAEMNYSGRIALFSNNEPFLDDNIISRHEYARKKLPNARFHLFTNGTLLTIEKFKEIVKYLDELIIDNYQQELKLIKPCKEIKEYCNAHPELKKKVTIVLRKPHEILTTRGGDAPNRSKMISYPNVKCVLPFKQMIVRPDGKVSLCCNDPLGKNTLGDLSKDSILDVWNNDRFKMVRECLHKGRNHWNHCEYCDVFNIG